MLNDARVAKRNEKKNIIKKNNYSKTMKKLIKSKNQNYKYFQNCKFYFVKKIFFEIKRIFKIACLIGGLLTQVEANKIEDNILKQKLQDLKNREIASRLTGLRLPSCKYIYIYNNNNSNNNNNNNNNNDSEGFGNMGFRSG